MFLVCLIAIPILGSVANLVPTPIHPLTDPATAGFDSNHSGSTSLRSTLTPLLHRYRVYEEVSADQADLNDSYDVFYDQLASEGHWIYAENYGYVFQPNIAEKNADWRPYTNGHWESTDRGWYWDTEEPFGWATYHYGRWANIEGAGWVWTPGTDWSPAWVSWRICETGFVGWAPLPPECPRPSEAVAIGDWCDSYSDTGPNAFCFLPFNAWFNSSYVGSFVPVAQNLELLNSSRNVTNISVAKTLVSSFGPRVEFIAQKTEQPVKTYTLRYSEVRGRNTFSRAIEGNLLEVNGLAAKLKANATKVPTVIKTIVRPTVNKGWNGLTKDEIDSVHRKYVSEAHIPSRLPTKPIEQVKLVPSATPTPIQPVHIEKTLKPSKTAEKSAAAKVSKGKAGNTLAHKASAKHKTASESDEDEGEESKSKVKSKTAKASKDTDDTDDGATSKKKTSSAKGDSSRSGDGSKSAKTSKSSTHKSKDEDSDDGEGSKTSKTSKGEGSKSASQKPSDE